MNEQPTPEDIAKAQVYATLAVAYSNLVTNPTAGDSYRHKMLDYEYMALKLLQPQKPAQPERA